MKTSFTAKLVVLLSLLSLCRCRTPSQNSEELTVKPKPSPQSSSGSVCAKEDLNGKNSDGDPVIICEQLFANQPHVRPPNDDDFSNPKSAKFWGAIYISPYFSGGVFFVDRNGTQYQVVDSKGKNVVDFDAKAAFPASMRAPTNRYLFTIYRVTGAVAEVKDKMLGKIKTIKIKTAVPGVLVTGCALDSFLVGEWQGTVSGRLPMPTSGGPFSRDFDEKSRVPLLVTLHKAVKRPALSEWTGSTTLKDGDTYNLIGTIDNLSADATSADGKKFKSLASLGVKNPFFNATSNEIEVYRQTNMHGIGFDNHWVVTYPKGSNALTLNGMTDTLQFFTPASLIGPVKQDEQFLTLNVRPHIPYRTNGHRLIIRPTQVGTQGGQCQ